MTNNTPGVASAPKITPSLAAMHAAAVRPADKFQEAVQQVREGLGYAPSAAEVADLIDAALEHGFIDAAERTKIGEARDKVRGGQLPPELGYAALLPAMRAESLRQASVALAAMFAPHDVVELRTLGVGAGSYSGRVGEPAERERLVRRISEANGQKNIYVGVNPRSATFADTVKPSRAENVARRLIAVLDFDVHSAPANDANWARTREALKALDPVLVVSSGNGWHYYFAIEPQVGTDALQAAGAKLKVAMQAVGSDDMSDPPRIIRLPGTVNIPGSSKRGRGNKLALARIVSGPEKGARTYSVDDLVLALHGVATSLGLPGRGQPATVDTGTGTASVPEKTGHPAPGVELLRLAMSLLPNEPGGPFAARVDWVAIGHAVKGAAVAAGIEAEGREIWLDWSALNGGDPEEPARVWDTCRTPHTGWGTIMKTLERVNPAGYAEYLRAEAKAVFSAVPPDLTEVERLAEAVVENRADNNPKRGKEGAGVNRAMAALDKAGAEFFHSPNGLTWVSLDGQTYLTTSAGVTGWLFQRGFTLSKNAKSDLREQMMDRALVGPQLAVYFRQGEHGATAFLNLMDDAGRAVEIDAKGWRLVPLAALPIKMATRSKALPLPVPVKAGDGKCAMDRLEEHVRLPAVTNAASATDPGVVARAVVITVLMSQFYRPGPVPHLVLSGPQGASKTSTARRLKGVTDPDSADVLPSLPADNTDLFAIAGQQVNLVLDNVSNLKSPDIIATLATGAGNQKRQLYSDGERAVQNAKASLFLTTVIENITTRPDLMDRMLWLELPHMNPASRKPERELNAAWDNALPNLLADLLDMLSGALGRLSKVRDDVKLGKLPAAPRLVDAGLLGEAAAQAAGWPPGLLLEALNVLRDDAAGGLLDRSPIAVRMKSLLDANKGTWTGTGQALFAQLRALPDDEPAWGVEVRSLQSFISALDRIIGPLHDVMGIRVQRQKSNGKRSYLIERRSPGTTAVEEARLAVG